MLIARGTRGLVLAIALAGCARRERVATMNDPEHTAEQQLRRAEALLPRVAYDDAAAKEVLMLLAEAERGLRTGSRRAWAATQIAYGRYWLTVPEPSLSERARLAQRYFDAAAFALELPADAGSLALVHAWLGTAQMRLSRQSTDPQPYYRRARDHFVLAQQLWQSVHAEMDVEAMSHELLRLDDVASRRRP